MNLLERTRKAIADATARKRERLAALDPAIDDEDEIAAVEAYEPSKALVTCTVGEVRQVMQGGPPSDPAAAELYRLRGRSIRDLPLSTEIAVQACDLLALVEPPKLVGPPAAKSNKAE